VKFNSNGYIETKQDSKKSKYNGKDKKVKLKLIAFNYFCCENFNIYQIQYLKIIIN